MKKYSIVLPYPPSVNHYWMLISVKGGGRKVLGPKGREFQRQVGELVRGNSFGDKRLNVEVLAFPPDKRKRDLDNILKPLLDALEQAGLYVDDCQIDYLSVERRESGKPGHVEVNIKEA